MEQIEPSAWFPIVPAYSPPADVGSLNRVEWRLEHCKAAILVHDMQRFWLDRFDDPAPLVSCVAALVAAARAAGVPIIYTLADMQRGLPARGLSLERWGPGISGAGPSAHEIPAALAPAAFDRIVRKSRYSAFFNSGLAASLEELSRSQIVITGVFAHHGCLATALDAYMRDIQAFVVSDAVGDYGYDAHLAALRYVGEVCGCVIAARDVETAFSSEQ